MKWRFIDYTENDGFTNMAIDEAICESVSQDKSLPTVRFYGWKPSCVSIGYFQSLEKEVDLGVAKKLGVDIVRRRTGGGAVYHDNLGEITYSVIAKESLFPKDILQSYQVICSWIIDSLSIFGIHSQFKPINDIITNGKKISGNAQTRRNGVLLQHGTILFSVDVGRMFKVLKVSDEKIRDKMISSVKERVTSCSSLVSDKSKDDLYRSLISGFGKDKEVVFDSLTDFEITRSKELASTKYSSREWNHLR